MFNVAWAGLADHVYWHNIARFCVPSWKDLPGDKFVIHDSDKIDLPGINVVDWNSVLDPSARFITLTRNNKQMGFFRKMQSQRWAIRNLTKYDFVVLLDTDVEVIGFNQAVFDKVLVDLKESGKVWATGESQLRKLDAGHIVVNMRHEKVKELFDVYENVWNSGDIFNLEKAYDGHVVESLFERYPSLKITNRDYGAGMHIYELGTVHWGSKLPKKLRAEWEGDGKSLVEQRLSEISIKHYKHAPN